MGKNLLGSIELNRIYQMDCLEGMKLIPDGSIDMILCDLPYGATQNTWDSIIPLTQLWNEYQRIIKENGAIVLTAMQPFTSKLVLSNENLFRYSLVWEKESPSNPLEANKRVMRFHEDILVFYKKLPTYNPQKEQREEKNKRNNKKDTSHHSESYVGSFTKGDGTKDFRYPSSVRKVNTVRGGEKVKHPTQKPVKLFEWLIRTFTNENEIVLDNCMGSGTSAVAALKCGRNFIGFETEAKYIEIANIRIESVYDESVDKKFEIR